MDEHLTTDQPQRVQVQGTFTALRCDEDWRSELFHICEPHFKELHTRMASPGCLMCRIGELETAFAGLQLAIDAARCQLDNKLPESAQAILAQAIKRRPGRGFNPGDEG